jgi:hypothetical protein
MAKPTVVERNARDPSRRDVLWALYLVSDLRIAALLNQFRVLSASTNVAITHQRRVQSPRTGSALLWRILL